MDTRDYDTLLRHGPGAPTYPAPTHAMVPTGGAMAPPGYHAPQQAPAHEIRQVTEALGHMQRELAQMRHGGHAPGHQHGPQHNGGYYTETPAPSRAPAREFPVGFIAKGVQPGATAEMEVKPQVRFQGHRLAVDPRLARFFNIVDIKIGKNSQLAATGEMPAAAFSALAVGVAMELDPAEPGIVITLLVRNDDAAPQDFKAVLYGSVTEKNA